MIYIKNKNKSDYDLADILFGILNGDFDDEDDVEDEKYVKVSNPMGEDYYIPSDMVNIDTVKPAKRYKKKDEKNFKPLCCPQLKEVRFCKPATIAWFEDGSKTVAIAGHGDKYDKEIGLAVCMLKRFLGNKTYREVMDKWCYEDVKDFS